LHFNVRHRRPHRAVG
jgi:hypothetical protein